MTENIDEVNQLLQDGWILMDIISDGHSLKFILGTENQMTPSKTSNSGRPWWVASYDPDK